jgi:hypothetical protein
LFSVQLKMVFTGTINCVVEIFFGKNQWR